jgi:hypothetical protein
MDVGVGVTDTAKDLTMLVPTKDVVLRHVFVVEEAAAIPSQDAIYRVNVAICC